MYFWPKIAENAGCFCYCYVWRSKQKRQLCSEEWKNVRQVIAMISQISFVSKFLDKYLKCSFAMTKMVDFDEKMDESGSEKRHFRSKLVNFDSKMDDLQSKTALLKSLLFQDG